MVVVVGLEECRMTGVLIVGEDVEDVVVVVVVVVRGWGGVGLVDVGASAVGRLVGGVVVVAGDGALISSSIELSRLSRSSTGCLLLLLAAPLLLLLLAVSAWTGLAALVAAGCVFCSSHLAGDLG